MQAFNLADLVKYDNQNSSQTPQPEPALILGVSLGHDQEKTEKERDLGRKMAPAPEFPAIHDQETFSGMAPILGLSAMHERRREQFAGDKW
jgi:hypothetical protein